MQSLECATLCYLRNLLTLLLSTSALPVVVAGDVKSTRPIVCAIKVATPLKVASGLTMRMQQGGGTGD